MQEPDRALRSLYDAGRIAWPDLQVDWDRFRQHPGARAATEPGAPPIEQHCGPDLYLACACALGDRRAIEAFERLYIARVPSYVQRVCRDPSVVEEVCQVLRTRLLVAEPGALPRIGQYSGRGPLDAWVRVTALRAAIELRRGGGAAPEDLARHALADSPDPELGYIRELYQPDFQLCFEQAISALRKRDRTLLRLHYVDRLNFRQIAGLYGVSRSTAHRWLSEVRENLLRETLQRLRSRLGVSAQEIESLANLARSQLPLTLSRLLGPNQG